MDTNHEDEEYLANIGFVAPISNIAWQMFTQTGMPGMYLLYRDVSRDEERTPFD